ncbi:hypothetical protein B296_00056841 [Ensete ventricosum]|uniref:Uncharacterized protein n=1 Tax=Ensete ventricosum TaxID=4639 RepID=A0A426XDQ7_ENSVE|nr:hypothetical protein B296_00056841 [Ensete ventricosum]
MSYTCSLSHTNDELMSFKSYLKWMYINQYDIKHIMVSHSLFLFLSIFVHTVSHFILSCKPTNCAYNVVSNSSSLSYLYLSAFIHRFIFFDKMNLLF